MSRPNASQGAGRLIWPLAGGFLPLLIAGVGGWLALYMTGSAIGLFLALAAGLAVYVVTILAAVKAGVWFSGSGAGRAAAS